MLSPLVTLVTFADLVIVKLASSMRSNSPGNILIEYAPLPV